MKGDKIHYKEGYKYQLVRPYSLPVGIIPQRGGVNTDFLALSESGILTMRLGYCWDGASNIAVDTKSAMRPSLIHDAIYQLIRMGLISESCRALADRLLQQLCLEDGMNPLRAEAWYHAVDLFAAGCAQSGTERKIMEAP